MNASVATFAHVFSAVAVTVCGVQVLNRGLYEVLVSGSQSVRSLRVMTWNIGKLYLPLDSRAADRDLRHVAEVIKEVDAHVVALQELRDPIQLGRLLVALGPKWRGRLPEDAYDRRAALLTRFPVRFYEFRTSTGRAAQAGEVTLSGGLRLVVTSVHLDAFDSERRARQAEEIMESLRRLEVDDLVLAGDFNFDPTMGTTRSTDRRLYTFLTRELIDAGRGEGGTTVVGRRLDYVFFRSQRLRKVTCQVLPNRRINIMDHDPVLAEFALGPAPKSSAQKAVRKPATDERLR